MKKRTMFLKRKSPYFTFNYILRCTKNNSIIMFNSSNLVYKRGEAFVASVLSLRYWSGLERAVTKGRSGYAESIGRYKSRP